MACPANGITSGCQTHEFQSNDQFHFGRQLAELCQAVDRTSFVGIMNMSNRESCTELAPKFKGGPIDTDVEVNSDGKYLDVCDLDTLARKPFQHRKLVDPLYDRKCKVRWHVRYRQFHPIRKY